MQKQINSIIKQDCLGILDGIDIERLRNRSVLLTGSNGLLGRYIIYTIYFANKLRNLNCKLYCISLHKPNDEIARLLSDKNIICLQMDLSEAFEFKEKVDYIFHAACYAQPKKFLEDKCKTIRLNINTTMDLLELAKDNKAKLMFFSSASVYGDISKETSPVSESYAVSCLTFGPSSVYIESKRMGETICAIYRRDYQMDVYVPRISHVYGPGVSIHDNRVLGDFLRQAIINKKINMLDDGSSIKTFGYIADIIYMIFKVMLEGKDFIYNIAGRNSISIKTLAEEVAKCCGNIPVIIPKKKAELEFGSGDKQVDLDISKFINEFGAVNFINFSQAIRRTVDWNLEEFE